MTAAQCRAARALLGMKQRELADAAGVAEQTIRQLELGRAASHAGTMALLRQAFEARGVVMVEKDEAGGAGVRFTE